MANIETEKRSKQYLGVVLAIVVPFVVWLQFPRLADPYVVEDDVRNMYRIHRYEESDLFPLESFPNLTKVTVGSQSLLIEQANPGYSLLLEAGTLFLSANLYTKLLPIPLLMLAVYYLFRLGETWAGLHSAFLFSVGFVIFNLACGTNINVIGGLQRSFAAPLLAALIFYLVEQRYRVAFFVVVLSALMYLPILPVAALTFVFSLARTRGWSFILRPWILLSLGALLLLTLFFAYPKLEPQVASALQGAGVVFTAPERHILNDPHYQPGGRFPLFDLFPLFGRLGLASNLQTGFQLSLLSLLALLLWLILRRRFRGLPPALRDLLYASLIGFTLSWLAIILFSSFLLYQPSRYTGASLLLILVFLVFANLDVATAHLDRTRFALLIAVFLPVGLVYTQTFYPPLISVTSEEKALYSYLETLPKDTLVSGSPCALDNVPFFSRRSVVLRCEQFAQDDEEKIVDTLNAYYASEPEEIAAYCEAYDVDYLVGDYGSFEADFIQAGRFYHEPYGSQLAPEFNSRSRFALLEIADELSTFQQDPFFVVPCARLA